MVSPTPAPSVLAIVLPSTATSAPSTASEALYQRPSTMRVFISGVAGRPQAGASWPATRTVLLSQGWAARTPGVDAIRRASPRSNGLLDTGWSQVSKWLSSNHPPVIFATPAPTESSASRVATANDTWITVAPVRRLRRPRPRRPIWTLRGTPRTRRSSASRRPWPPTAEPTADSASLSGNRVARRTAGSAASGGPTRPTSTLAITTGTATANPASTPKNMVANSFTSPYASPTPSAAPITAPSAPSISAVRR